MNQYKLKVGRRTRFFNTFRQIFRFQPFEKLLAERIRSGNSDSIWLQFAPPNYLYPKNSHRYVERAGIKYRLDISDFIEHWAYFGAPDLAHEKLFRLATNQRVLIDVGVNIGTVLLNFAKVSPDALIFGFEPDEKNYQKAQQNLELNNLKNVTVIKKGLGEQNSKSKLFKVNDDNEGMNRILDDSEEAFLSDFPCEEIDVIKLDDFMDEKKLSGLDLIKIDVEGYELKVLKGAIISIEKYRPTMFIEVDDNNLKAQNDSAKLLIEFLEKMGYGVYRADNSQILNANSDFVDCHFDAIAETNNLI